MIATVFTFVSSDLLRGPRVAAAVRTPRARDAGDGATGMPRAGRRRRSGRTARAPARFTTPL
ncbi:hypothetical protein EGY19_17370 [Burkholderia multivorans]|nr:hypothetical protein EGY19_17370 [Burkholderia multivorans]PRF41423.1 hypothetical protein C6Q04_31335 [Burkholderia multivorans]PRG50022.1 hypothetical protein C6T63_19275 [Burkholderia multivorans]